MYIQRIIRENIKTALNEIFKLKTKNIELQQTKKEFDGDITLVVCLGIFESFNLR